jgi:hypothetical protein
MIVLLLVSSLSSSQVLYDGNNLKLSGDVVIEHPLGKMHAEEALIERPDEQSESFDAIHLCNAVRLELKEYGKLLCQSADFDFKTLTGNLKAKSGEKISYLHHCSQKLPLEMKSPLAHLLFEKGQKGFPLLTGISILGGVEASYAGTFALTADHAHLDRNRLQAFSSNDTLCHLKHGEDIVEAKQIELKPDTETLTLAQPKGHFHSLSLNPGAELVVQCDTLLWNNEKKHLEFKSNVAITESSLGQVQASEGSITYEGSTLTSLFLDKEVLLRKYKQATPLSPLLQGERFAKADHLHYRKENETIALTSNPGERVLLWDEEKALTISANEIQISRDPITNEENIKGIGNVRFHFSPAESALIQKLFPNFSPSEVHANPTR